MKLFDTLTRKPLELKPRDGETFRFYCCGPTVYGPAHIGNFRTFVLQDVFRRTLELSGQKCLHVRNLTDLDDKTIRDSQANGKTLKEFTDQHRDKFHEDCEALNLLKPHVEPSAVEHIPHQIAMIEDLISKGHAYAAEDGSVYFKISSFDGYGKLSHLDKRELRSGASGVTDDEYDKESASDFVLWKARRDDDGENFWESPWGQGRPGWHLECSAMSREYLGETFDLHSGGVDLIFPHHENEIAQSEACTGCTMADHWFHLTHLLVDGGKMSKSANNFYTIDQLAGAGFSGAEVRYVLIAANYRQPLNFVAKDKSGNETFPSLSGAKQALEKLAKFEAALLTIQQGQERARPRSEDSRETAPQGAPDMNQQGTFDESTGLVRFVGAEKAGSFGKAFSALLNDLNTPEALGQVFTAMKSIDLDSLSPEEAKTEWLGFRQVIDSIGLRLPEIAEVDGNVPADVAALAEKRWQAKQDKDWAASDALRDEVAALGWVIKDTADSYEVVPK